MSQLNRTNFEALYGTSGTKFPNNTTGLITEAIMREFGKNLSDSFINNLNDLQLVSTTTGTDTYTINGGITAYANGYMVVVRFANTNTGASTLNVNSVGAKAIRKNGNTAVAAGDLVGIMLLMYDSNDDNFKVVGKIGGGGSQDLQDVMDLGSSAILLTTDVIIETDQTVQLSTTGTGETVQLVNADGAALALTNVVTITGGNLVMSSNKITGLAAATANGDAVRYEQLMTTTTNRQTASYSLVLADANKLVEMNVAGANDLTVPLNATQAFPVGTSILIAQYGSGQTTVVATGGVTIRSSAGKMKLTGQYSMATLIKIATDEWYLSGDITT